MGAQGVGANDSVSILIDVSSKNILLSLETAPYNALELPDQKKLHPRQAATHHPPNMENRTPSTGYSIAPLDQPLASFHIPLPGGRKFAPLFLLSKCNLYSLLRRWFRQRLGLGVTTTFDSATSCDSASSSGEGSSEHFGPGYMERSGQEVASFGKLLTPRPRMDSPHQLGIPLCRKEDTPPLFGKPDSIYTLFF